MREIQFSDPHRQRHFDFFNAMAQPHFSICAQVDITHFRDYIHQQKYPFTPTIVFLLSYVANAIPAFRQRIRNGSSVVEHEVVHPSFTVATEASDVFSFCEVAYNSDFLLFLERTQAQMVAMRQNPSFEDEAFRDDYLFLSSIPWVSFTGLTHAMHTPAQDSVPRITWGKFFTQNNSTLMPLSVQAHHALVDGRHMGMYFQLFEQMAAQPEHLFG